MELNTDILFEALSKIYKVEAAGCTLTNLSLDLPEHYLGGGSAFKKDHVYIARTDQLPPSPELEGPALLICLGGSPPNWYFNSEFSLLIVKTAPDILTLFNKVQAIYRKYNEWADALDKILETTADIQELIDVSLPVFNNFSIVSFFIFINTFILFISFNVNSPIALAPLFNYQKILIKDWIRNIFLIILI